MAPFRSRFRIFGGILVVGMTLGCVSAHPRAGLVRDHIAIHARGNSREIDAIATLIQTTLTDLSTRLDLQIPATQLEIRLFGSPREMRRYLRQHCPEQSGKAGACYARPGGFVVTAVKSTQPGRLARMLRHEFTHFLLASHYRDFPRWIDEGLAQFMEINSSRARDDKRKEFRKRRIQRTRETLVELLSLPMNQPLDKEQYLLSWAVVSFLAQQDQAGLDGIKRYLAVVETDGTARSYFESTFGPLTEEFLSSWESFLSRERI